MKLLFFGTSISSPRTNRHARILDSLLDGVADRGHHVVFIESAPDTPTPFDSTYAKILRYDRWDEFKLVIEKEAETTSAIIITDGFAEGARGVDWLLDLPVPARIYYSLDPWVTLKAFEAEGAAPWVRADQIPAFDLLFSLAGGPAVEAFKTKWGAQDAQTLFESFDPAQFHPRQPAGEYGCDLAMVADRDPASEPILETFLLEAARMLPTHRFIVAGQGWENASGWPENVHRYGERNAEERALIYSSARLVLVPRVADAIDYSLSIELLEPMACGAACAVIDRPGLTDLFVPDREILVPRTAADLVPYLTDFGASRLLALGTNAEKAVLLKYAQLPCSRRFLNFVAKEFFGA